MSVSCHSDGTVTECVTSEYQCVTEVCQCACVCVCVRACVCVCACVCE